MIRWHVWLIGLLWSGATTALPAQDGPPAAGDTVRVRNAVPLLPGAGTGILVQMTGDTLVLRSLSDSGTSSWLLRERSRLSVKRGRKSFGVLKGVLIGATIAVAGTLLYEGSDSFAERGCEIVDYAGDGSPIYGNCDRGRREAGILIIPLGAIVGGVAGRVIKRDRWVDVPRPERAPR